MSEEKVFKLLQNHGNKNLETQVESEPFTISRHFSHGNPDFTGSDGNETEFGWKNRSSYRNSIRSKLTLKDGEVLPRHLKDTFDFDKLACKPLQEVDLVYTRQQTFLTIGKNGTVHRFSGRQSPFILNPLNPLRRIGIYLLSHWHLQVLITISLCLLCFSFLLPNYANNAGVTERFIRYFLFGVLLAELFVNVVARGILVTTFTYLRSPWDWLDFIVISIIFLNICWENLFIHSLYGIALLKFIPIVPALKDGFSLLLQILKNLVPVSLYSLLILWIFVMFGQQILNLEESPYNNNNENCSSLANTNSLLKSQGEIVRGDDDGNDDYGLSNLEYLSKLITINGNYSGSSLENSTLICSEAGAVVHATSIHNITLQALDLVTLGMFGGFQNEINPIKQHFLYTFLILVFGVFGIGVFTLTGIGGTFLLLKPRLLPKTPKKSFTKCLPEIESPFKCDSSALNKINEILYHPFFELLMTLVISIDILLISVSLIPNSETLPWSGIISYGQQACLVFYVAEFTFKLLSGPFRYLRNGWVFFLDVFVVFIFIIDLSVFPLSWLLPIRIFKITSKWPTFKFIVNVPIQVLKHKLALLSVLLLVLLTFEVCTRRFINGYDYQPKSNHLDPWSFAFFFKDWSQLLKNHDTSLLLKFVGFVFLLLEGLIGTVLVFVIFVSVIHETCEGLRQPSELKISESYKNLIKAVEIIKSRVFKKDACLTSGKSNQSPEEGTLQPVSGCNGEARTVINNEGSESSRDETIRRISVAVILIAMIALVLEFDPVQQIVPYKNPRFWIDAFFVGYFLVVFLWKGIFYGIGTLGSPCWMMDFIIITASGFTLYTAILSKPTIRDLPMMKFIAILSCLRGLMLISRLEWLKVATIGIISEMKILWRYFIALAVVSVFIFSVRKALSNSKVSEAKDNLPQMLDSNNNEMNLEANDILFPTEKSKTSPTPMNLLLSLIMLGILSGVAFLELLANKLVYSFMTNAQVTAYKDKEGRIIATKRSNPKKTCIIPHPKNGLCIQIIHYVTQTEAFDLLVTLIIICDCLVITFSHLAGTKDWQIIWSRYPGFILFVYVCELLLKCIGWRKHFFRSWWNIFDMLVVALGIFDLLFIKIHLGFITSDFIRFFRILRIFQLKIVTRYATSIRVFFSSTIRILPIILDLCLLYGLLIYTYFAVALVSLRSSDEKYLQTSQGTFQVFKNTTSSLILLPYYGTISSVFEQNLIAQAPSCWNGYFSSFLSLYINSYMVLSYIIIFNFNLTSVYETLKYLQIERSNEHAGKNGVELSEYKHTNGSLSIAKDPTPIPDDPESIETLLTPSTPNEFLNLPNDNENRVLSEAEKYPVKISANGYVLHVEAIVTTV